MYIFQPILPDISPPRKLAHAVQRGQPSWVPDTTFGSRENTKTASPSIGQTARVAERCSVWPVPESELSELLRPTTTQLQPRRQTKPRVSGCGIIFGLHYSAAASVTLTPASLM